MTRTPSADASDEEFAPESSLLSIKVRRSAGASLRGVDPLHLAWREAFDPATGIANENVLKASLGQTWAESFLVERPVGGQKFDVRAVGRLPEYIQELLTDGDNLSALMAQINHMAMVNSHSVIPTKGVVELDESYGVTSMNLTLLPLASRGGVVNRYLGTLGQ